MPSAPATATRGPVLPITRASPVTRRMGLAGALEKRTCAYMPGKSVAPGLRVSRITSMARELVSSELEMPVTRADQICPGRSWTRSSADCPWVMDAT